MVKVIPRDRLLLELVVAKRVCAKFLKEQVVRFSETFMYIIYSSVVS